VNSSAMQSKVGEDGKERMYMNYQVTDDSLRFYLEGRITSDNARELEKEIGAIIEEQARALGELEPGAR